MRGSGYLVSDKPVAVYTFECSRDTWLHFNWTGNEISHHSNGASVRQRHWNGLTAVDRPPLGRQAEFRAMNASLFRTCKHDLGIENVTLWIGVGFFDYLRVLGQDIFFTLRDSLIPSAELTNPCGKFHDDPPLGDGVHRRGQSEGGCRHHPE